MSDTKGNMFRKFTSVLLAFVTALALLLVQGRPALAQGPSIFDLVRSGKAALRGYDVPGPLAERFWRAGAEGYMTTAADIEVARHWSAVMGIGDPNAIRSVEYNGHNAFVFGQDTPQFWQTPFYGVVYATTPIWAASSMSAWTWRQLNPRYSRPTYAPYGAVQYQDGTWGVLN